MVVQDGFINCRDELREIGVDMHVAFDGGENLVRGGGDWHVARTIFE